MCIVLCAASAAWGTYLYRCFSLLLPPVYYTQQYLLTPPVQCHLHTRTDGHPIQFLMFLPELGGNNLT